MRTLALAAAALVAALLLAACGSSGTSNGSNATPQFQGGGQAPQIGQQTIAKLRACLKKQGVTLPSGGQPGQGQAPSMSSKFQQAMQACSQYLPSQSGGGFGG